MNLSINQATLAKAISTVSRAVTNRPTLPILANILLRTQGEQLQLSATNRDMSISIWVDATIDEGGSVTIPARILADFVGNLPPEAVNMQLNERTQTMHLNCKGYSANIRGIDANEFPLLPTWKPNAPDAATIDGDIFTVPANALRTMINRVAFAASTDDNRPTLTGVEARFGDSRLQLAATDGYRLSVAYTEISTSGQLTAIIPARAMAEVARTLPDDDTDVTIVVSKQRNQVLFGVPGSANRGAVDIVSSTIDAKFPDYTATVPKASTTHFIADTEKLRQALKVALLFARDNNDIVQIAVGDDKLCLSAQANETGDNESWLDATTDGARMEIRFNGQYLMDALGAVATPRVYVGLTQPTRPGILKMPNDETFYHVAMPMHPPK